MPAMPIGSYQFDNLVSNHVPFALFTRKVALEKIYSGEDLKFILRQVIELPAITQEEIFSLIQARGFKKDHPIVVMCESGAEAPAIAHTLEEMGYINTFFVLDGFQALLPENR
jgi:rhodanese-related sulfurtransferase